MLITWLLVWSSKYLFLDSLLLFIYFSTRKCYVPFYRPQMSNSVRDRMTLCDLGLPYNVSPAWLGFLLAPATVSVSCGWPTLGKHHNLATQPALPYHSWPAISFPAPVSDRKYLLYMCRKNLFKYSVLLDLLHAIWKIEKETQTCLPFHKFSNEFVCIEKLILPCSADDFLKTSYFLSGQDDKTICVKYIS